MPFARVFCDYKNNSNNNSKTFFLHWESHFSDRERNDQQEAKTFFFFFDYIFICGHNPLTGGTPHPLDWEKVVVGVCVCIWEKKNKERKIPNQQLTPNRL